ncbi:putative peptide maturation dehydrogenase [Vulcaniibacterium gelatinicum]|uniref:putative peptide maturation dehydrogenase n=1 Tax=Vulcaniibacterium gelatinicum TaxID=2598725 RepID=UPI0015F2B158|nr:putative peptide maturation dehydrogenase [Vulcaniibacterium gelatinicum]
MRVRRRSPCLIEIDDELLPDFNALLQGEMRLQTRPSTSLLCPLEGRRIGITPEELAFVAGLTAQEWYEVEALAQRGPFDHASIESMTRRGILVSEFDTTMLDREAKLADIGWHPLAAVYHAMTRWQGVIGDEGTREHGEDAHRARLQAHVARHGPPPPHFPRHPCAGPEYALPLEPFDDAFARLLQARRTTRHFDQAATLALSDLSRVLYGTFGAIGTRALAPGVVAVKRTSASGGALQPTEAYPLVIKVEGLAPGFYHYQADTHSLALVKRMDEHAARELASALTIGQIYFAEAHALVFHVVRLDRHHWKYRRHAKAYKAALLDSGHLSQTFYLLAADRGLGAFYTAAINDADLVSLLDLDPLATLAVGTNGIGVIDGTRDILHFMPEPYTPTLTLPGAGTST